MSENIENSREEEERTILRDKVNTVISNINRAVEVRFNEYEVKINKIKDALEKRKEARQKRIKKLQSNVSVTASDSMTDIINDLKIN
jgi:hypothetical protein